MCSGFAPIPTGPAAPPQAQPAAPKPAPSASGGSLQAPVAGAQGSSPQPGQRSPQPQKSPQPQQSQGHVSPGKQPHHEKGLRN